ncbi:MAG TPA: HAMP domain-containing sensor histidine kinase [Bdellovibrio sp.]|uniref:sensor histidine kinase n=1 Tax=Bdellovibrio sp. TaxID=28201 RepID=UPI002EF73A3E
MLKRPFTAEEAQQKRLHYLKAIYLIVLAVSSIYILKFNFEYHLHQYNPTLLTSWLLTAIIPPVLLYYFRSFFYSAVSVCLFATTLLMYLLYLSGGVDAPGIFWLSAVPLVWAILLQVVGAVSGYAVVLGCMAWFWYLKGINAGPNVIAEYGNYAYEKSFNVITFLTFSAFTTHHFIRGEEKLNRKLQEQNNDVENLLRVLLHDIANTLSTMTYNLIKAREEQENLPAHNELDKIERAVEDINNLLTQVRHLKAVKDGKTEMPLKPVSLAIVLNEVFEKSEPMATQKGIKIALDLTRDKMVVHGEKTILSNVVLLNLMNNAVKFSHPGNRIDLRAYSTESSAIIEIQDYGIGIPDDLMENLFSLNSATTRVGTQGEKGTGYGMPLVREYLQMMGGSIQVSSREVDHKDHPRGTKVILKMPLVTQ